MFKYQIILQKFIKIAKIECYKDNMLNFGIMDDKVILTKILWHYENK